MNKGRLESTKYGGRTAFILIFVEGVMMDKIELSLQCLNREEAIELEENMGGGEIEFLVSI